MNRCSCSCCLRIQLFRLAKQNDTSYFGPITGRVAQRISRGRFVLDGKVYHLYRNDGRNTLHGMEAYTQRPEPHYFPDRNMLGLI